LIFARSRGDWNEGVAILRDIVDLHPPFIDDDHQFAIRTKNGAMLSLPGKERVIGYRELLEEAESKLGRGNHITCIVHVNYADALVRDDQVQEGESQLRMVVEAREAQGGEDDLYTSVSRRSLAFVLAEKGDRKSANQILVRELEFQRRKCGHSHRDTLMTLRLLGMLLRPDGVQASEDVFSEHIDNMRREEGPISLDNLHAFVSLLVWWQCSAS
jgi:hypothetical protein